MHADIKIFPATTPEQIETIRTLFIEYQQWLNVSLCFQGFDQELATLPGKYSLPNGRLYLAECNDTIAGCIALRPMEENGTCEMKRLFVRQEFRELKIGRILTEQIIADAKEIGYHTMRLDTLQRMETARALYTKLGFTVIPAYYNNPMDEVVYMELLLNVHNLPRSFPASL
ncbi:MAG: GNAT family N-acetyltransferase [Bacteriovoracaceae bacterium]|nr:GNAT family N-acetyltransferase [Bacteroidota bacterium]